MYDQEIQDRFGFFVVSSLIPLPVGYSVHIPYSAAVIGPASREDVARERAFLEARGLAKCPYDPEVYYYRMKAE